MKSNHLALSVFRTGILVVSVCLNLNFAQAANAPAGIQSAMQRLAHTVTRLAQEVTPGASLPEANVPVTGSASYSIVAVSAPLAPPASLTDLYWPMHDGDWRTLETTLQGNYIRLDESITYESSQDLFRLHPDESSSFGFRYQDGNVILCSLSGLGIDLWFDTPLIFLKGSSLPKGGSWTGTTTSTYGSVTLTVHAAFALSVEGTVTAPLGTFSDCRKLTVSLTASAQGRTESLSSQAFMLAPGLGYFEEAILNSSNQFAGWANLTSGAVNGVPVADIPHLDISAPSLVLTSPKPGQRYSNEWFTVAGTARDNGAVTNVWVQVNDTGWNEATSLNNWSNWNYEVQLTPGTNTILAMAADSSGNLSPTSTSKVVYVLSGRITVFTNPPGAGTVSGVASGQMLEINRSGTATATPNAAGGWAFTNWTGGTDPGALAILTNKPALQFTMVSNLILKANFTDIKKPDLAITNPAPSGIRVSNAFVDVKGWSKDNDRVTNIWVKLNQGDYLPAQTGNNWTNWMLAHQLLTPGTNWLFAYAADATGNLSATVSNRVIYVLSAPLNLAIVGNGTVTGATNGQPLEIGKPVTLKATPGQGYVLTNWWVEVGGLTVVSTNRAVGFVMQSNLTLTATFVDTNRPVVAVTNLVANQRISNAVFTVRGKVTDNAGVSNVWYRLNSAPDWLPATGVVAGRTSLWSAPLVLEQRTNKFEVWAEDTTGNRSATGSVNFVYVKSGPLLVAAVGQGTVSPNYSNAMLEIGLNLSVKAAGANGYQFRRWEVATNWLDPVVVTNATLNFVMQSNLTLTAVFADTNRPVLTVTNLVAKQRVSNAVFTVRGKVTDNAGVSNVWYRLNGAADWLPASGVVAGRTSLWSAPLVLEQPTNKFEVWAEDATGIRSATNNVSFVYVKLFTLTEYFPLPLGAYWLYNGTDSDGYPTKFSFEVTDTNYVITNYTGTRPVIGYRTNCVRLSAAYLDETTQVPYESWDEYMAIGPRFGSFGDDDLPNESMRVAGGLIAPAQMALGTSVTLKANAYMFGTNAGTSSFTFQLIEHTSLIVPAGSFPDVLHMRWNMVYPGGAQVHDEWWAKSVGKIKRLHLSGHSSAVSYELIQYSLPSANLVGANTVAPNPPLQFDCGNGNLGVANGYFQMRLSGPPDAVVVVESSPDLVHWLPIHTNTLMNGSCSFSDPQRTNYTHRFYRFRSP